MKKLILLSIPALFIGCASDNNIGADGPVPSVTENNTEAVVSGTAEGQEGQADVNTNTLQPKPWSQPVANTQDSTQPKYPVATAVSGKPGIVRSPYAPYAGEVDVREYQSGKAVRCPYTGKIFIVP